MPAKGWFLAGHFISGKELKKSRETPIDLEGRKRRDGKTRGRAGAD
jgi:hypothetical protein